mmetsp:Transcript_20827/g.45435  ORF Transcript_20827/g.45435 Transcript_20827/m.45435 type:complete len:353 (-) Transcript_20827:171-1229(-)
MRTSSGTGLIWAATLLLSSPACAFLHPSTITSIAATGNSRKGPRKNAARVLIDTREVQEIGDGVILYEGKSKDRVRFRGRVAYDGTGFNGWQTQSKGRTVQAELEEVLSRRFNRRIIIVGAGRTDAGVHARGQAFHFDLLPGEINTTGDEMKLQLAMNSMLRRDTRVWNVSRAPTCVTQREHGSKAGHKWHVIYESTKKLYSYRICTALALDPKQRFTRCHICDGAVDLDKLRSALKHFEGSHDFRAFAGAIEQNERRTGKEMETIRTVYKVDLVDEGKGNYRVDFMLKGALYKMVRNMMGTALEVAKGRMQEQDLVALLNRIGDETRKNNRCKPAPPEGLCLERVYFSDGF